jgi:hypothetical protein
VLKVDCFQNHCGIRGTTQKVLPKVWCWREYSKYFEIALVVFEKRHLVVTCHNITWLALLLLFAYKRGCLYFELGAGVWKKYHSGILICCWCRKSCICRGMENLTCGAQSSSFTCTGTIRETLSSQSYEHSGMNCKDTFITTRINNPHFMTPIFPAHRLRRNWPTRPRFACVDFVLIVIFAYVEFLLSLIFVYVDFGLIVTFFLIVNQWFTTQLSKVGDRV